MYVLTCKYAVIVHLMVQNYRRKHDLTVDILFSDNSIEAGQTLFSILTLEAHQNESGNVRHLPSTMSIDSEFSKCSDTSVRKRSFASERCSNGTINKSYTVYFIISKTNTFSTHSKRNEP
jgi:hypothetical protein